MEELFLLNVTLRGPQASECHLVTRTDCCVTCGAEHCPRRGPGPPEDGAGFVLQLWRSHSRWGPLLLSACNVRLCTDAPRMIFSPFIPCVYSKLFFHQAPEKTSAWYDSGQRLRCLRWPSPWAPLLNSKATVRRWLFNFLFFFLEMLIL
jgi:hypothetical protein